MNAATTFSAPSRSAMRGGFMPFCSETTTVSDPTSGAMTSSAASVSCDFTARNVSPSGPRS
jgi:hypothetical protein